jgi:citrate synthase
MERKNGGTMGLLAQQLEKVYGIGEEYYRGEVKRGLRNSDGTGVLIGVTKVGSVQGYLMQDGQRVPTPGHLYYRGIDLNDIVEAHRASGTFGYEEVAYLLLMGSLPARGELARFKELMNRARKLPDGFTESMILRRPSQNIMNELARSVLALYSYDDDPDDTGTENLLAQSIRLIGSFPAIVANAYAIKRHYFEGESLHIHYPEDKLSTAENFLRMIRPDKQFTEDEAHLLDMMLMLHAEHGGGNNSTFVCRAISSSMTDTYSAIAGAVGSLKGPLHGGANAKVMEMLHYVRENTDPADDGRDRLSQPSAGPRGGRPLRQALRSGTRGLYDVRPARGDAQEIRPEHGGEKGLYGGF